MVRPQDHHRSRGPGRCGRTTAARYEPLRPSGDLQRLRAERTAVLVGDERVGVDGLAVVDGHDDVDVPGPRALGVESRRLRRVVRVAVVVAHDVETARVSLALDPDVVARVDLVAVAGALDHYVARAPHLGDGAVAARAEQDAADLVRVALGAVRADR